MLREMAGALEALTAERPVVLVLEDLHWSDAATLDLLAFLGAAARVLRDCWSLARTGRRRYWARTIPLRAVKQELHLHGHCAELALEGLTEAAVAEYLTVRFSGSSAATGGGAGNLPAHGGQSAVHGQCGGGMGGAGHLDERNGHWELDDTRAEAEGAVPATLRQLIERQLERLSEQEQQVLEAASVAGAEFAAAAVAAGVEAEVRAVEECCARTGAARAASAGAREQRVAG